MKLQKLDFRPKVLRKEEMVTIVGGYSYCWQSSATSGKFGTSADWAGTYD